MLILSIESSTPSSSVALVSPDRVVASATLSASRRHGQFLAPAIRFCLQQCEAEVADVTGVAVGVGPGLFTGLRVGMALAQAFAEARRLPVVGLSGLDVMAFATVTNRPVVAVTDARRKEVFWAAYRRTPGGVQRVTEPQVATPEHLAVELAGLPDAVVVGDGADRYAQLFEAAGASVVTGSTIQAADLGRLAVPRFVREETQRPDELRPLYLRTADVKIGWQTRGKLHGGKGGS